MNAEAIFGLGIILGFLGGITLRDAFDLYRSSRRDHHHKGSRNAHT